MRGTARSYLRSSIALHPVARMTVNRLFCLSPNRAAAATATISAELLPTPFTAAPEAARNTGPATHGPRTSTKNS